MPYHAVAVGKTWAEVEPNFQILIIALMKVLGGGFLATGVAMVILLLKAFIKEYRWSFWAIPLIGLIAGFTSLFVTIHVTLNTPASPPWIAAASGIVLLIIGFVLSMLSGSESMQDIEDETDTGSEAVRAS